MMRLIMDATFLQFDIFLFIMIKCAQMLPAYIFHGETGRH